MSNTTLRLVSDIHLELIRPSKRPSIEQIIDISSASQEILILAGDIGDPWCKSYFDFLKQCSSHFKHTIIVPGNHEYYKGHPMDWTSRKIFEYCKDIANLHYLNVDTAMTKSDGYTCTIDDTLFIGMTLWAPGSKQPGMNDMVCINKMNRTRFRQLHELHRGCLLSFLRDVDLTSVKNIVIVTHHLPSEVMSHPKYGTDFSKFYVGECDDVLKELNSDKFEGTNIIWCCGHSHQHNTQTVGRVRMYLNPFGYPGEDTGYRMDLTIV